MFCFLFSEGLRGYIVPLIKRVTSAPYPRHHPKKVLSQGVRGQKAQEQIIQEQTVIPTFKDMRRLESDVNDASYAAGIQEQTVQAQKVILTFKDTYSILFQAVSFHCR